MDPYTEIQVTPLFSEDGMQSQGKSVRIADDEGWDEIGVVSSNYLLVHNTRIRDTINTIAEKSKITDWKERKVFFDGRRFIYAITTEMITAEVSPGDIVRFGLIGYNSYDGSRAISVGAYAEHLVCSNGMTSEMYFSRFQFRHNKGNVNWDEQTEEAFLTILPSSREKLQQFSQLLNRLTRKHLTMDDLATLRKQYLGDLSVGTWGKVVDQYLKARKYNAFGLLDACTGLFWHNEKPSYADYRNNSYVTDNFLRFAEAVR